MKTLSSAANVVERDLDYIVERLPSELESLSGRHLLITGGAGFLGYYMVQAVGYWNRNHDRAMRVQLSVYDNYARGVPGWLERWKNEPGFNIRRHDIVDPLPNDMGNPDYIVHAAGIASPTFYRAHPIETMDANVGGLRRLLDHARSRSESAAPVQGFLFFSSSEIYGDPTPENIPTPETYRGNVSCTGPRACYDESKRYGETLSVNFARQFAIPISIARPFNNYGPGLKITDRRVIPDFANDVLSGRDIALLSDGTATRTFCYVADAVVGYYKVLVRGRAGEAYNIGVETPEVSIGGLGEHIVRIARDEFGYKGSVVRSASEEPDYLVDNPNRRCPVITKARDELGYRPSVDLNEGLRRSLFWYSENREGDSA